VALRSTARGERGRRRRERASATMGPVASWSLVRPVLGRFAEGTAGAQGEVGGEGGEVFVGLAGLLSQGMGREFYRS